LSSFSFSLTCSVFALLAIQCSQTHFQRMRHGTRMNRVRYGTREALQVTRHSMTRKGGANFRHPKFLPPDCALRLDACWTETALPAVQTEARPDYS
jgi:hypothetical protein